jgi:hypothetical protein
MLLRPGRKARVPAMTCLLNYFLDFAAGTAQPQGLPRRRPGAWSSIDLFNRDAFAFHLARVMSGER